MKFFFNKQSKKNNSSADENIVAKDQAKASENPHGEIASVIAVAIHLYINQVRAYENNIITIQKIMKPYSPWSSKIYGMRQPHSHTAAIKPNLR